MKRIHTTLTLAALAGLIALATAPAAADTVVIADSVSALTWTPGGGYQSGGMPGTVDANTLTVDVTKNKSHGADLGNDYALNNTGDWIEVTLSFQFNHPVTSGGGNISFGFTNDTTNTVYGDFGANGGNFAFYDNVNGSPRISGNFSHSDPNSFLNSLTFRIEKTDTGFDFIATSNLLNAGTATSDETHAQFPALGLSATSYNRLVIVTTGNAMKQGEDGEPEDNLTVDITELEITTNVPEPASLGLMGLGGLMLLRRR